MIFITSYWPSARAVLGEYCPQSFWYGPSEASRSVQERLRAIFSQYGPELVKVNKNSIIWLCLTLHYLKSEPWRIGMNETVHRKAFKTAVLFRIRKLYLTRKSRNFQRNCLLSLSFKSFELFESNVLSHFLYSRFTSRALTSLIMPVGITGKSGPEYWPITARVKYVQALSI